MTAFTNRSIPNRKSVVLVFLVLTLLVSESVFGSTQRKKQPRSTPAKMSLNVPQGGTITKWKNERESIMVLINDGNGNLTGEYTTAVGCKEVVGKPQKLFGTINGTAITFTVNWGKDCGSVTSWVGQMESPTKIKTLWLLGISNNDPKAFKVTYAGSDVFTKQSP